jgi:myo-inositol 2-dehydrogenase/D-chiro-inositol 1-dehydrogenase
MGQRLGFGVIGVGAMGRIHARHLASRVPGARLVAVADVDDLAATAVAEELGGQAYERDSDLLTDPAVEAVVIATPRAFHKQLVIDAAAAGKHLFCEKPLASTVEECTAAMAAAETAKVKLQIGFHRRFDASFSEVHDTITAGGVGALRTMHMTSRDPEPAAGNASRSPADLILETSIHDLDMARYLSASEIVEVYAAPVAAEEAGSLEGVLLQVRMANGVVATIDNHLHSAYGYDQRVEAFGTGGMVSIGNETPHRATVSSRSGVVEPLPLRFFEERYDAAYTAELAAFARCIAEGSEPAVTGADGRAAVAAALAALRSLEKGTPVRVEGQGQEGALL